MIIQLKKKNMEWGATLLEASLWFLLLSVFILGAFYLVHHIQKQRFVENIVDKNIRATSLRPFQLKGNSNLAINEVALNSYLVSLANTLNMEINNTYGSEVHRFIDIAFGIVPVNTETGKVISYGEVENSQQIGSSDFISSELLNKTDLRKILQSYVKEVSSSNNVFIYATPLSLKKDVFDKLNGSAGIISDKKYYAPQVVFVLARVFFSTEKELTKHFIYEKLGIDPVYKSIKIVNLRGDYDL